MKYNKEEGNIYISTNVVNKNIFLEFKDNGLGISSKDQKKLFNEFYRVENDQTKKITGTGLGLSIVQRIVNSYKGRITVKSKVNYGSTFSIKLPVTNHLYKVL